LLTRPSFCIFGGLLSAREYSTPGGRKPQVSDRRHGG
jgi:hypothetical protein